MNLKDLADKLTTELTGLKNYVVTDDAQWYSEDTELGGEAYIPALLSLVSSFENENRYIRTLVYQLRFKVLESYRDDFYDDIDTFKASQTTEVIGSNVVTKVVQNPITTLMDTVNGLEYFEYQLEMIWTYALSKVGTAATISVDGVEIPFTSCDVIHDIAYVSNQSSGSNYRMTNDLVTINIPLIVANAKVLALYNAVNSDAYNTSYTLSIDGVSKSVVLKKAQYTFTNTATLTGMILTFETAYPRVTVTIDGESLAVTAYQYQGKKLMETAARNNLDITKGYATSKTRTWSITIVKATGTAWSKLIADAYGDTLGVTYTLVAQGITYTVELADAIERYTETGDMTLECQFVEYGT